jgi:hypothetical protein
MKLSRSSSRGMPSGSLRVLERWHIPRLPAALLLILALFGTIVGLGTAIPGAILSVPMGLLVVLAKSVSGRRLHDSCGDEGDRMLRNVAYWPKADIPYLANFHAAAVISTT